MKLAKISLTPPIVAISVALFAALSSFAGDATMAKAAGWWFDASTWVEGVPPSGAGATLTLADPSTYSLGPALYGMTNDVTIGHIVYPAEKTKQNGSFFVGDLNYGTERPTTEYPSHDGHAFGYGQDKTITFDAGGGASRFANENPESVHGSPNTAFMMLMRPLCLKSDLEVTGIGRKDGNVITQPAFAMALGEDIKSDDGKHGLTFNVGTATKLTDPAAIYGENSDFTGDVTVQRGNLRLISKDSLEHEDTTPLGHDNNVYVTSGEGYLDIGDHKIGKTQHLYIGTLASSITTAGSLLSSYSDRTYWPEWKGKVTLMDNAFIGGYAHGNTGYGNNRGNLLVSGDIDDGGKGYSLTIRGNQADRAVKLTGQNTYSGGTVLAKDSHLYAAEGALGTGPITWSGGVYHYEGDGSCDISELGWADHSTLSFSVPAGVTYTPSLTMGAFDNIYKSGRGTLVLAHENKDSRYQVHVYGGELRFDFDEDTGRRMNAGQNCWLYEDARIVVTNLPAGTVAYSQNFAFGAGAWATFSNTGDGAVFKITRMTSGNGAIAVVEDPENFLCSVGSSGGVSSWTMFYKRETWAVRGTGDVIQPFADFADSWGSDSSSSAVVDVTSACSDVPADAFAKCIRMNDPTCGTLTLNGDLTLSGGVILITENMGSTPVKITGGRLLTGNKSNPLYIVNMNTKAPVTVETDLAVVGGTDAGIVCAVGPGKINFSGANSFLGGLYINDCELAIDTGASIGTTAANNGDKTIVFSNRAKLVMNGTMTLAQRSLAGTGFAKVSMTYGRCGAHLVVPNAKDTVTITEEPGTTFGTIQAVRSNEGDVTIEGPGKYVWKMSGKSGAEFRVCGGATVYASALGNFMHDNGGPKSLKVEDGSRLEGAGFLQANGTFGAQTGCDVRGVIPLRLSGTVTYDVSGSTRSLGTRTPKLGAYGRPLDAWIGEGVLKIVNSSAGTSPTITPVGFKSSRFTGKVVSEVPFQGEGGLELPNVEFVGVAGVTHWFQSFWDNEAVRFGALSGDGVMKLRINVWNQNLDGDPSRRNPCLIIGRDKPEETCVYNGSFDMGQHNSPASDVSSTAFVARGAPRIVKVGTNKMKITNADSWIVGSTIVRGGDFLVGNDSLPTEETGYKATLGKAMVLVGDDKTEANAVPQLLIDGEYTVANDVNVPSISDATALPGVGGNATCVYTGTVKVFRRTALVANGADTVVTFDKVVGAAGEDESQAPGLAVKGNGKVVIKSVENIRDFGCDGLGGQIIVEGDYVIPEGAKFVFTGTIPAGVDAVTVLTANSVTGTFASVEGLPDGWTVRVRGNKIVVTKVFGFSVIVR